MRSRVETAVLALGGLSIVATGVGAVGAAREVASQSSGEFQKGSLSPNEISQMFQHYENYLTPDELSFISQFLSPYLTPEKIQEIAKFSGECAAQGSKNRQPLHIIVVGIPFYTDDGKLENFVPFSVDCGASDIYAPLENSTGAQVTSLQSQLIPIIGGLAKNTLAGASGDTHNSFQENGFVHTTIPHFAVGENGTILEGARRYGDTGVLLLNSNQFIVEFQKILIAKDFCSIIPPSLAAHRLKAEKALLPFTDPDTKKTWYLEVCSHTLDGKSPDGQSGGPTLYVLDAFPLNVQRAIATAFGQSFPLSPDQEKKIQIHIPTGNNQVHSLTIYQEKDPSVTSTTIGYNEAQQKIPQLPLTVSFEMIKDILLMVPGATTLAIAAVNTLADIRRKRKTNAALARAERRQNRRYAHRLSYEDSLAHKEQTQVQEDYFPSQAQTDLESVSKKTFTNNFGEGLGEIETLTEEEVVRFLEPMAPNEQTQKGIYSSRREISQLISLALGIKDSFEGIDGYLQRISKRVTEFHVGGDSITIDYHILHKGEVVHYLLIDIDLEERSIEVAFHDDKIENERAFDSAREKLAKETIVDPSQEKKETVAEAAKRIVDLILLQLEEGISESDFLDIRQECAKVIEGYGTDSRVKEEVKRQLAALIEKQEIPIIEWGNRSSKDSKPFGRIIGQRLYDSMYDVQTGEARYEAFTQNAKNLLDGKHPLKQTAVKAWETHSGFRIQIVQVQENNNRRVVIVFTNNNH
jgi:hypothetical protein